MITDLKWQIFLFRGAVCSPGRRGPSGRWCPCLHRCPWNPPHVKVWSITQFCWKRTQAKNIFSKLRKKIFQNSLFFCNRSIQFLLQMWRLEQKSCFAFYFVLTVIQSYVHKKKPINSAMGTAFRRAIILFCALFQWTANSMGDASMRSVYIY